MCFLFLAVTWTWVAIRSCPVSLLKSFSCMMSAEKLQKLRVVCAAAQPSGHSLALCLHGADINWTMVLGHCLGTADPVLTCNVTDVGKKNQSPLTFLITTSAPVFVHAMDPKLLVRESTQGSRWSCTNEFMAQWMMFWKAKPQILLEASAHEVLNIAHYIGCLHERGRRKGLPINIFSTNQHSINAVKGMVCLYTHPLMHVNMLNSVRTCKARSCMNLAVTHSLKHFFSFCLHIHLMPNGPRTSKTYFNLNLSFMLLLLSASSCVKASFSLALGALSSDF